MCTNQSNRITFECLSIVSGWLIFDCQFTPILQFAIGMENIWQRIQRNRTYAQALALLVVCAVKISAVSSIVSNRSDTIRQ